MFIDRRAPAKEALNLLTPQIMELDKSNIGKFRPLIYPFIISSPFFGQL
jgi:hypothetical protein